MIRKSNALLLGALLVAVLASHSAVGFSEEEKKKKELPQRGVLSVSGIGQGSAAVEEPWGGVDQQSEEKPPIGGSVTKISDRQWQLSVNNSTKDTYSFSVEVNQKTDKGDSAKRDFFSFTLKGGETAQRTISGSPRGVQAELALTKWKNLSAKKKKAGDAAAEEGIPESESDMKE